MFGSGTLGSRLDLTLIACPIAERQNFQHIEWNLRVCSQDMSQCAVLVKGRQPGTRSDRLCRFASESIYLSVFARAAPRLSCAPKRPSSYFRRRVAAQDSKGAEGVPASTSPNSAPRRRQDPEARGILQWRSLRSPRSACSRSRTCATRRSCTVHAPGWTKRLSSTTSRSLRLHGSSG